MQNTVAKQMFGKQQAARMGKLGPRTMKGPGRAGRLVQSLTGSAPSAGVRAKAVRPGQSGALVQRLTRSAPPGTGAMNEAKKRAMMMRARALQTQSKHLKPHGYRVPGKG